MRLLVLDGFTFIGFITRTMMNGRFSLPILTVWMGVGMMLLDGATSHGTSLLLATHSILSSTLPASVTSCRESTLDLVKFVNEAESEIAKTYGPSSFESGGALYFQEGLGSLGSPQLNDFSTLTYIKKPNFPLELPGIKVGYRLELTGATQLVYVSESPDKKVFSFSFPGTVFVVLKEGTPHGRVRMLLSELGRENPKVKFEFFESILMIQVEAPPLELIGITERFRSLPEHMGIELNMETFAYPAEFAEAKLIATEATTLNLDFLRGLTRPYQEAGQMLSETCVPERLRPE